MTSPYRQVLSRPGAVLFSATGLVARLPISMVSLAIVLLVSARTGSYGTAGAISASYVAANAVGAVPLARLVDRRGQAEVLGPAVTVSTAALVLSMVAIESGWPAPWPHLAAALAGLTFPNVGAAVRARWAYIIKERTLLDTAFALEAVNDEVVFVVGPALTTFLATSLDPLAGLVAAGIAAFVGTWAFIAQRATAPPRGSGDLGAPHAGAMPWARLVPLITGAVSLGVLFGGIEVAVVAFASERGERPVSGALLALFALGSLLAGLITGNLVQRRHPAVRYRYGLLCLALLIVPLPFVSQLRVLGVLLFLAGFAISPTLIAAASWVEVLVPSGRLNEGMTVFSTGLVAGVAPGAALVGAVVDAHGASASFWVSVVAGLAGAAAAFAGSRLVSDSAPAGRARA